MSTQCQSVTPTDASSLHRTRLIPTPVGRAVQDVRAAADHFALESAELLETLEQTIARLALAHRAGAPATESHRADEEAFAWVQQSLEDISATLRGLSLGRTTQPRQA